MDEDTKNSNTITNVMSKLHCQTINSLFKIPFIKTFVPGNVSKKFKLYNIGYYENLLFCFYLI